MSDKISLVEQSTDHHQHPTLSRRWLLFIAICLTVFGLLGWFFLSTSTRLDGIKRYFRYNGLKDGYGDVTFQRQDVSRFALLDDRLLHAAFGTATVYREEGEQLAKVSDGVSTPAVVCRGSRALIWDIGGEDIVLLSQDGTTLLSLCAEACLYDADLAKNGSFCILTEGNGSRAVLDLYNKNGKLLFRRISKSNYLNTCAISPDSSYVAATTLGQEDISFSSTVQIFHTASEDAPTELSLGGQLIYDLTFLDKQTLCALGERSLMFFSVDGTLLGQYTTEQGHPIACSFDGDGFVTVVFDLFDTGSSYRLLTLGREGTILSSTDLAERPLSVSANGRYVAVLTEHNLQVYDDALRLHFQTSNAAWLNALVRSDGTVYCLGSDFAKLYIP